MDFVPKLPVIKSLLAGLSVLAKIKEPVCIQHDLSYTNGASYNSEAAWKSKSSVARAVAPKTNYSAE